MHTKKHLSAALAAGAAAFPVVSGAEVSANFGWASQYLFRGIFQEDSSASAGLDYVSDGGFYVGTWGADVGDGLETDLYFGYAGESGGFSYSLGATGYYYTDDFDDTYQEINVGVGYGMFSVDYALGEWDGFGSPADYRFTALTLAPERGPYYTFASHGDDFDGDYVELGYGFDLVGADLSIALTYSDDLQVSDADDGEGGEYALVFGINKSLSLGAAVD